MALTYDQIIKDLNTIINQISTQLYGNAYSLSISLRNRVVAAERATEDAILNIVRGINNTVNNIDLDLTNFTQDMSGVLRDIANILRNELAKIEYAIDTMSMQLEAALETMTTSLTNAIEGIASGLQDVFAPLVQAIIDSQRQSSEQFVELLTVLQGMLTDANDNIKYLIQELSANLTNLIITNYFAVQEAIAFSAEAINHTYQILSTQIEENLYVVYASIRELIVSSYDTLDTMIETEKEILEKLLDTLIELAKTFTEFSIEDLITVAQSFREAMAASLQIKA